jgi:hypothetical protein
MQTTEQTTPAATETPTPAPAAYTVPLAQPELKLSYHGLVGAHGLVHAMLADAGSKDHWSLTDEQTTAAQAGHLYEIDGGLHIMPAPRPDGHFEAQNGQWVYDQAANDAHAQAALAQIDAQAAKAHAKLKPKLQADAMHLITDYQLSRDLDRKGTVSEADYKAVAAYWLALGDWQQGEPQPALPRVMVKTPSLRMSKVNNKSK